ncbi:sigma-70 family RNA polymerase sigma factor [Nocardioides marmoriginsengisoli]|uniref:sigma-70 family RNA polymerase sigma factor n=1 Tax=Nocardioides marmoriginsengisoli TaxID=661483 RepID=UPI00161C4D47|nr:sigma-70 family RNA polymerase sigma factor [Nocardioides marmoriginsengisoli]
MLQPPLLRFARNQLDPAGAEDVVAETLTTLWGKDLAFPESPEEERGLHALAYQVLTGHIRNEYRSRRRRKALAERLVAQPVKVAATGRSATDVDDEARVTYLLQQLSVDDREVILLFNAGFDLGDTARILGCSTAAAAKRRTRARGRLREIVDKEARE